MKPEVKKALGDAGQKISSILGVIFKILGTIFLIFLTTGSILAVIVSIYISKYLVVELDVNIDDTLLNQTSIVYYTNEKGDTYELETLHGTQNRILATYDEIPQHMIDALVAIEDKRFFEHEGVDWRRTIGAFVKMFTGGSSYGGSTITQQLIKNMTGEKDDTIARKIQEILRALDFEKKHSKEEILELYLNTCYFGQGCWGVKTAAERYFGKELSALNVAEAACIVGITNLPTAYDPILNPEKNKKRQEDILYVMYNEQHSLTEYEYKRALDEMLVFINNTDGDDNPEHIRSFFVDRITIDFVNDLAAEKDISRELASTLLYNGGYRIYATIDMRIQGIIDEVYQNDENFPVVKDSEKPQSSLLIMDPYTGSVLGMAGARGVKTGNLVLNLTQTKRQPGSSIKPVAVYAAAMDLGFITPYSVIDDAPSENNGKNWPRNSGGTYKGRTNVLTAVQNSVNTVAVKIIEMITPQKSFNFAHDQMGLTSLVYEEWVMQNGVQKKFSDVDRGTLALGGLTHGLTVRELTAAYCAFVNRGMYTKARTYSYATDANGDVIIDNRPQTTVAMKEKTAYYMNVVLQQAVNYGTGASAKLKDMPVAGKTGTTTEDKDRWFVGSTPYYTCGSWFGFAMPKKIKVTSGNPALTMWKLVMEKVHEGLERKEFFTLDGLVTANYCLDSGLAPSENCSLDPRGSRVATGVYAPEDVPKKACDVHTKVNVCGVSGLLATPYCPAETLRSSALLNITRGVIEPVYVADEQYVIRYWNPNGGYGPLLPEGKIYPTASGSDGRLPYNSFCTVHTTGTATPTSITSPSPAPDDNSAGGTDSTGDTDNPATTPPDNEPVADITPTPTTAPTPANDDATDGDDFIPID